MYSPTLGRWMQQDPMGYVDGANLYEYLRGASQAVVDPTGTQTQPSTTQTTQSALFGAPSLYTGSLDSLAAQFEGGEVITTASQRVYNRLKGIYIPQGVRSWPELSAGGSYLATGEFGKAIHGYLFYYVLPICTQALPDGGGFERAARDLGLTAYELGEATRSNAIRSTGEPGRPVPPRPIGGGAGIPQVRGANLFVLKYKKSNDNYDAAIINVDMPMTYNWPQGRGRPNVMWDEVAMFDRSLAVTLAGHGELRRDTIKVRFGVRANGSALAGEVTFGTPSTQPTTRPGSR